MAGLINGKKELRLPWRGNCFYANNNPNNDPDGNDIYDNGSPPVEVTIRMKTILNQFASAYKNLIEEREKESMRLNRRINILPEQFVNNNLVELILNIWNDDAIREAYDRRRETPKYFVENVPYFIENLDRIGKKVNFIICN